MPDHQNLDQKRASHAWNVIQQVKLEEDKQKEFKIQVKKLPARILAAGLGQSLAFLEAKHAAPLLRALADWINRHELAGGHPSPDQDRLLLRVVQGDADFLRFATAECLAYLQWLVRFADAEFKNISEVEEG
jgi:CRISPR/Cas system CMR-associated protein Cmr5 small subunit